MIVHFKLKFKIFSELNPPHILVIFVILGLSNVYTANAQKSSKSELGELVNTELNFALQAKEKGIPFAFLNNLDSTGLIVSGNKFQNGLKAYDRAKSDKDELLLWRPSFAYVNVYNDFGFTSGPFLYFAKKDERPLASGFYFSIWEKKSDGKYKLQFDGGVVHSIIANEEKDILDMPFPLTKWYKKKVSDSSDIVFYMKEFENIYRNDIFPGVKKFSAKNVLILRPDQQLYENFNSFSKNNKEGKTENFLREKRGYRFDLHQKNVLFIWQSYRIW